MSLAYLDASALVKLVTVERETSALRDHLERYESRATSRIASVEVPRALARKGAESVGLAGGPFGETLARILLIELDERLARMAAALHPASLRSLDAIHLASALSVAAELSAVVTYDARLAEAARGAGLRVESPV